MKWSHLPVQGGIYDQNPDLLDKFRVIFQERAAWEAEEEKRREREKKPPPGRSRRIAGRR